MMMARACAEPRLSQNTMVPLTTACAIARNEYARRFEVIETPGVPGDMTISSSAASRTGGSSLSWFANTIQPLLQSKPGSQRCPSLEWHTLTTCARLTASERARNRLCSKPFTAAVRVQLFDDVLAGK